VRASYEALYDKWKNRRGTWQVHPQRAGKLQRRDLSSPHPTPTPSRTSFHFLCFPPDSEIAPCAEARNSRKASNRSEPTGTAGAIFSHRRHSRGRISAGEDGTEKGRGGRSGAYVRTHVHTCASVNCIRARDAAMDTPARS